MDNSKAYEQACNTARHYSNLSSILRIASFAQGLILAGIWVTAFKEHDQFIEILVSLFGFLLTWLLFNFNRGYMFAWQCFYKTAAFLEEGLFDENARPINNYLTLRKVKYKSLYSRITILYAPYTLIALFFLVAFFVSIFRCPCY